MGNWLAVSGISGFLGVALGAFGAHGLQGRLGEGAKALDWWKTAAHYQLIHALALAVVALVIARAPQARYAGFAFVLGSVLFCGSLYAMALGGPRWLGAATPLGGLGFLTGWAILVWCGLALSRSVP